MRHSTSIAITLALSLSAPAAAQNLVPVVEGQLVDVTGQGGNQLGYSCGVSGDTAVLGGPFKTTVNGSFSGSAIVFTRSGTDWSQQQELFPPDSGGDTVGRSVAIDGDTLVFGASRHSIGSVFQAGAAYVYVRSGTQWTQQAELTAAKPAAFDNYGIAVTICGDTVAVGASTKSGTCGLVDVYQRTGTQWVREEALVAACAGTSQFFGGSLALSGDTLVVGDKGQLERAFVHVRNGTDWPQQAVLTASDNQPFDDFADSVAIDGDVVLVGAKRHEPDEGDDEGAVYAFVRSGTTWTEEAMLTAAAAQPQDNFGQGVSLYEDTAAIGAGRGNKAYLFTRSGTQWTERVELLPAAGLTYGTAVGIDGFTLVVTDDGHMTSAGIAAGVGWGYRLTSGVSSYCTAGTSASGCQAVLYSAGAPSATAPSGFVLSATGVEGSMDGLFYFSSGGRQAIPWGNGTSYRCVTPPTRRGGLLTGVGTAGACDGSFSQDLNARWCPNCPKSFQNPGAGSQVQAQLWFRDPQNTSNRTTSFSDALEVTVEP